VVPRDYRQTHPPRYFSECAGIDRSDQNYIENHNQNPQAFVWTAPVAQILTKVAKSKEALDALHYLVFFIAAEERTAKYPMVEK
jgi:hypothetical protein